jgi:hypothetical protein
MPQSLSKVIFHFILSTRDRESWLDRKFRQRIHAYLATIYRDLCTGPPRRRRSGSCSHHHDSAAHTFTSAEGRAGEEDVIKMDQEPRARISRVFLAAWARFRSAPGNSMRPRLRRQTGRASPGLKFSGGIPGFAEEARRRVRRALTCGALSALRASWGLDSRGVAPG